MAVGLQLRVTRAASTAGGSGGKANACSKRPTNCVDCLEALRDTDIRTDQALIQEARGLAMHLCGNPVHSTAKNTRRSKDIPNGLVGTSAQLVAA